MTAVPLLISFVVDASHSSTQPPSNPRLPELVAALLEQTDPMWELLVVVATGQPELDVTDDRVRAIPSKLGPAVAGNVGLATAVGTFVAFIDPNDSIEPDTVEQCRRVLVADPSIDVLYTDEVLVGPSGQPVGGLAKPDFSPERLRAQHYLGQLVVYRRSLLQILGGLRPELAGALYYDLALRATEQAHRVTPLPRALYRRRVRGQGNEATDLDPMAAQRAVVDQLDRLDVRATVTRKGGTGWRRIVRELPPGLTVSVLVPSRGDRSFVNGADRVALPNMLQSLLTGFAARPDLDVDVTVLVGPTVPSPVRGQAGTLLDRAPLADGRLVSLTADPWSAEAINDAVLAARGQYVLLIADWVTLVGDDWPAALIGPALDPTVGLVGPRLLTWDGRVAAAGLALTGGSLQLIGAGVQPDDPGPSGAWQIDREVTALPADCVLVNRMLFLQAGGLTTAMPVPAGVIDLGLKAAELGHRVILTTACSAQVGSGPLVPSHVTGLDALRKRWGSRLASDIYWRAAGR